MVLQDPDLLAVCCDSVGQLKNFSRLRAQGGTQSCHLPISFTERFLQATDLLMAVIQLDTMAVAGLAELDDLALAAMNKNGIGLELVLPDFALSQICVLLLFDLQSLFLQCALALG